MKPPAGASVSLRPCSCGYVAASVRVSPRLHCRYDSKDIVQRQKAVVSGLSAMREMYRMGYPWCKGQIEVFFKSVTDIRHLFREDLHASIDEYNSTLKQKAQHIDKGNTFNRMAVWKNWAV
eukprot:m.499602 g.499602  ORF g.499602 m.499602 type:complete len:121 (-) comp57324_c0_seq12:2890-3252(-)